MRLNKTLRAPIVEMILFSDSDNAKDNLYKVLIKFNITIKEVTIDMRA